MILVAALTACASRPPSREQPQPGCLFDEHRRFEYILLVGRDTNTVTWVRRQLLSTTPDTADQEEHVTTSIGVRRGYCPDEMAHITGRERNVWRQDAPAAPGRDEQ